MRLSAEARASPDCAAAALRRTFLNRRPKSGAFPAVALRGLTETTHGEDRRFLSRRREALKKVLEGLAGGGALKLGWRKATGLRRRKQSERARAWPWDVRLCFFAVLRLNLRIAEFGAKERQRISHCAEESLQKTSLLPCPRLDSGEKVSRNSLQCRLSR